MWNKRGCIGRPQAFAEQHSAWPPKWYTCSFCRREFRSAQALGGHMNVHRRDRVRLKQCSDSSSPQPTDNNLIPGRCLAVQLKLWKESSKLREEIHNRHAERKYVEDNHDEGKSSKRSRNSAIVSPLLKAQELLPAGALKLGSCRVEELDLELRLGYPHKIK